MKSNISCIDVASFNEQFILLLVFVMTSTVVAVLAHNALNVNVKTILAPENFVSVRWHTVKSTASL